MYVKLPETATKFETVIDTREILCFNEKSITFKGGQYINSCEQWNKVLIDVCNRLNKVFEKIEGSL